MAFGKVFIRTASGETDEYTLTKPSTTIGRQPGNDIVLNTSMASRYHARIDVANGGVFLVDLESAAGTFVNDVQVEPGGSVPLSQGDTISIGDVLLIYTSPQARGRLDIALAPTPAAVERRGVPFVMVLDEPQQLVAPGARLQLILVLENLADRPLDFNISTSGIDETWLRIDRRALRLDTGEQAHVVITVLPPRSSDTRPGRYALTVRVALAEDPNRALEAVREIDVVGYSGLALDARRGEEPGTYYIAARNEGNIPLDIELGGYMRGRLLTFDFDPPAMLLGPGETGHSALVVEPAGRKRPSGPLEFAIVARSRDAAGFYAPLRTVYVPERRGITFPAFVALMLLAGVLFTAVLAAGAWAFGLWPFDGLQLPVAEAPEPTATPTVTPGPTPTIVPQVLPTPESGAQIRAFEVSTNEAPFRTAGDLTFAWRVVGGDAAAGYIMLDDTGAPGQQPVQLPLDEVTEGTLTFPIAQLPPGDHNFRLIVLDDEGAQLAQQVVGVSIETTTCRMLNPNVPVRTQPEEVAPPATPPRDTPEVLIAGRTEEGDWLWVAYNDLEALEAFGWVPAGEVNCPPGVVVGDIVVVPAEGDPLLLTPAGDATPSPAAETLTPGATTSPASSPTSSPTP